MMSVELKHHPEEWFFLHNFDIDKVFSTIQRADYLILYYIKICLLYTSDAADEL